MLLLATVVVGVLLLMRLPMKSRLATDEIVPLLSGVLRTGRSLLLLCGALQTVWFPVGVQPIVQFPVVVLRGAPYHAPVQHFVRCPVAVQCGAAPPVIFLALARLIVRFLAVAQLIVRFPVPVQSFARFRVNRCKSLCA